MMHLLFAVILTIALAGAIGESVYKRKAKKAIELEDYGLWSRYHKYSTWCKIVGIAFAMVTGFLGGQLYIK